VLPDVSRPTSIFKKSSVAWNPRDNAWLE